MMAESVVSIVSNVTQHITSTVNEESQVFLGLENQVNALKEDLQEIQEYLIDAKEKGELLENVQVRAWVAELRSIAYDAEDVIDTYILKAAWKRHGRICTQFPLCLFGASKWKEVQKLRDRIQEATSRLKCYGIPSSRLRFGDAASVCVSRKGKTFTRSHFFGEHKDWPDPTQIVTGLEEDIKWLVRILTRRNSRKVQGGVAIVGMVGSGKTILASKLYNHPTVQEHFDHLVWVSLSQGSDTRAILVDILAQIKGGWKGLKTANQAQSEQDQLLGSLTNLLQEKSCLVVVDDVWNTEALDGILPAFNSSQQSKIIFTSQKHELPGPSTFWFVYETRCLTEDEGWKLFGEIAFKHLPRTGKSEILGKQMMRKCEGLPLLIVTLGKILSTKDSVEEWERIFSKMEGTRAYLYQPVNDVLALSYNDLPHSLKLCFLYLGLFPQGCYIPTGTLIRMWIAEGFVKSEPGEPPPEAAGMKCIRELIDRSLVQVEVRNYSGEVKALQLHDIMRDLCIMKGMELDFLSTVSSNSQVHARQTRRAAINVRMGFQNQVRNPHLRSLLLCGQTNMGGEDYTMNIELAQLSLVPVCEHFKLLRVLDIVGIETCDGTLPSQIGNLIHLRYMRIKHTNIRELPKSIGSLRNLLTLDYWRVYVDRSVKLPNILWKLERLRHLFLPYEMSVTKEEFKLHNLRNLQVLWGIAGGNWMLKEMKMLSSDLKKLCIQGISSREQLDAVFDCPSIKIADCLSTLALDWYGFELDSLEALQSRHALRKLRLMGRAKEILKPFQFPRSLMKLELYYTQFKEEETMNSLGDLPFLKSLKLSKDSFLVSRWVCSDKAFPQLEELKLFNLPCLEEWKVEQGAMPCLTKMTIALCLKLNQIPEGLKFIRTLKKLEIERMQQEFCIRLQQVRHGRTSSRGGEDFHIVKHIPDIRIQDPFASLC